MSYAQSTFLICLTTDLATQSKVCGPAKQCGLTTKVAASSERLLEDAQAAPGAIVVLDLSNQGIEPGELVASLKALPSPPRAILAFGPHVHENRLAAATEAGCDGVFSRGEFFMQTAEILRRYL